MNVLILGAAGQLARWTIEQLLERTDVKLTLYLRNSARLTKLVSDRVLLVEGDVLNVALLKEVMAGQDIVYANLSGRMEDMAKSIVEAMNATGLNRLIFISSMGIYDEVPGEKYGSILDPYRKSTAIIESSKLDYTIIRPAWFNNYDEINYKTTRKGQSFKGSSVSRKSVADLIVKLVESPSQEIRQSLGISQT